MSAALALVLPPAEARQPDVIIMLADRLFNLAEDPGENHDLSAQFPERLEAMKEQLRSIHAAKQ